MTIEEILEKTGALYAREVGADGLICVVPLTFGRARVTYSYGPLKYHAVMDGW